MHNINFWKLVGWAGRGTGGGNAESSPRVPKTLEPAVDKTLAVLIEKLSAYVKHSFHPLHKYTAAKKLIPWMNTVPYWLWTHAEIKIIHFTNKLRIAIILQMVGSI